MSSAACPRCAEPVRLPPGDAAVTVRCPWCHETFELGEVLKTLPPMLEIVGAETSSEHFEAPLIFDEDPSGFSHSAAPMESGAFAAETLDATSVRSSPRRSSRTSPVVGFLKIAGGGIAGILIALAILQYFNRVPDLGFWPFRGPAAERGVGNSRLPYQPRPAQLSPGPSHSAQPGPATGADASADDSPNTDAPGEPPVELPLPEFGDDAERLVLARSVDRAERALADYHAAIHGEDDEDVASDRLEALSDALASIGQRLAESNSGADEERRQIDALVQSLATDHRLLKELLQSAAERVEAADPETAEGLFFIGQLSADNSEYHLKKNTRDPQPLRMLVDEGSPIDVPAQGAVVIALGTIDREAEAKAIRAHYVAPLVPQK